MKFSFHTGVTRRLGLGSLVVFCFLSVHSHANHLLNGLPAAEVRSGSLSTDDSKSVLQAHLAGLSGDTTQISAIIDLLSQPLHPAKHETAMLALARLGAVQALPQFDDVMKAKDVPDVTAFALTARARLVAENQAASVSRGPSRAAKVARFYQELNLSPQDLNRALADYQQNYKGKLHVTVPTATVVGQDAVEQLADMVYHDRFASASDYASLSGIAAVNFSAEPPAALKMRLAPLSQQERITTMIHDLTHRTQKVWSPLDNDEVQLLDDEGQAASRAVAVQLTSMEQNRSQYPSETFEPLFSVLHNIGDKEQTSLVAHFKNDPDPKIADDANFAFGTVSEGIGTQLVYGY